MSLIAIGFDLLRYGAGLAAQVVGKRIAAAGRALAYGDDVYKLVEPVAAPEGELLTAEARSMIAAPPPASETMTIPPPPLAGSIEQRGAAVARRFAR